MADLSGINLAMQTPMHGDGSIDFSRYEELLEQCIDAGVHGIVLGAGTGQHPYLTEAECNKLYEIGGEQIDGRCNMICQTSALNMDEIIRRSKHAESIGAVALMILPPYLEGSVDDEGVFAFYRDINTTVNVDIIGYNIPQATGISVSPALFDRLGTLEHFNYIKDSADDLSIHQAFLQKGTQVLNGCDPTTVFALMAGASGAIWGGVNYMPVEAVRLYKLVAAGQHSEALSLWGKMIPSLLYIWYSDYIPAVKVASKMCGFDGGGVRSPLRPLSAEAKQQLRKVLEPLDS